MATYLYKGECIYETDKGSGKDYTSLNFEFKLSRFFPEGAGSHIIARFLPTLIRKQKNKPLYSGLKHWVITDVQKLDDNFILEGKDINEMNEDEIQQLACMYDILEIPLPSTMPITELRRRASLAYLKKVLRVPMKTPEEQAQSEFFKRQPDGSLKFDLGDKKLTVGIFHNYIGQKKVVKKKTLEDYIKQAGQAVANGVLAITGNIDDGKNEPDNSENGEGNVPPLGDGFPSADELLNG